MVTFLTVVHIFVCLFLILVVLLQAGKGGGMGIAFGGAGSQTVFGSSGAGNFLTRLTSGTAAVFLITSLSLAHYSSQQDSKRLQKLASERAAEKKVDDEKAAKLKADLEKARAAAAGNSAAPGAPTTTEAPGATQGAPGLQLKVPELLDTSGKKPTGAGSAAPAASQAAPKPGAATPPAAGAASPAAKAVVGGPPRKPRPASGQAAPATTPGAATPSEAPAPAPAQVP
jgi:preprotein translocase subunit SecG